MMKARIKLAIGAAFAAAAVMAVPNPLTRVSAENKTYVCYSDRELDLLVKAHGWTRQEAKNVLDLACKYSHQHDK